MKSAVNIRIEALSAGTVGFAVELLFSQLAAHAKELGEIDESPADCYLHSLGKNSDDPVARARAKVWADKSRIDLGRLDYFVAIDEATGNKVGVSGIYSVMQGYLARETGGAISPAVRFETGNVFWMGWTAVIDVMKGCGVGTRLMRHGILQAREIADRDEISDPYWAILADAKAVGFYEKRGFTKICAHGSGVIFADRLEVAAGLVDPSCLGI